MEVPTNNPENDPVIMIEQHELDDDGKVLVINWFATSLIYETSAALDLEVHVAVQGEGGTIEFTGEIWYNLKDATDGCATTESGDGTFVTCVVANPPDEFVVSHAQCKEAFQGLTKQLDDLIKHLENLQERRGEE